MNPATPSVSIVIPVFNEEDCIAELRKRLTDVLADLPATTSVVLVNDGSSDGSLAMIREWCASDSSVCCVDLSRNFGEQAAASAGLAHADGDFVVVLHADLQDPPELIPEMLEKALEGADVVFTRRIGRDEDLMKRAMSTSFYAIMGKLARTPFQGQAGDFKMLSRRVVDAVNEMPEKRRFLRGMISFVGFEQVPIDYRRSGRSGGQGSSYPVLFKIALEAVVAYSDVPLSLATIAGTILAAVAVVGTIVCAVLAAIGTVTASLSLAVLMAVLFLGGAQLMTIGIIGSYVARIHEQTLQRPLFLVNEVISGDEDGGETQPTVLPSSALLPFPHWP